MVSCRYNIDSQIYKDLSRNWIQLINLVVDQDDEQIDSLLPVEALMINGDFHQFLERQRRQACAIMLVGLPHL